MPIDGTAPRQVTAAEEGVFGYEWAPDGQRIAYLIREPGPEDETRQRQDRSFVIHADAPDRPTRLALQDQGGAVRPPTVLSAMNVWGGRATRRSSREPRAST